MADSCIFNGAWVAMHLPPADRQKKRFTLHFSHPEPSRNFKTPALDPQMYPALLLALTNADLCVIIASIRHGNAPVSNVDVAELERRILAPRDRQKSLIASDSDDEQRTN